jgi:hypothetical protein
VRRSPFVPVAVLCLGFTTFLIASLRNRKPTYAVCHASVVGQGPSPPSAVVSFAYRRPLPTTPLGALIKAPLVIVLAFVKLFRIGGGFLVFL